MIINKKTEEITLVDVLKTGIYDNVDLDKERKNPKVINKLNLKLVEIFIEKELEAMEKYYKKINIDLDYIITDHLQDKIDNLNIIAARVVNHNTSTLNKNNHWKFKGYITLLELKDFIKTYQKFKDKYADYMTDYWRLELGIVGAIAQERILVDNKVLSKWAEEGVLIELFGFDKQGKLTSLSKLLSDELNKHLD